MTTTTGSETRTMTTIPEHGGTPHPASTTPPIITIERHDLTAPAPSAPPPITAPRDFDIESHVLDHAGAFYDWFDNASINPASGNLQIVAAEDSAEYLIHPNDDPRASRLREFTPDQVWAVILQEHEEWQAIENPSVVYERNYFDNLIAETWDDLDGDSNTTDTILQRLAFGETMFG